MRRRCCAHGSEFAEHTMASAHRGDVAAMRSSRLSDAAGGSPRYRRVLRGHGRAAARSGFAANRLRNGFARMVLRLAQGGWSRGRVRRCVPDVRSRSAFPTCLPGRAHSDVHSVVRSSRPRASIGDWWPLRMTRRDAARSSPRNANDPPEGDRRVVCGTQVVGCSRVERLDG